MIFFLPILSPRKTIAVLFTQWHARQGKRSFPRTSPNTHNTRTRGCNPLFKIHTPDRQIWHSSLIKSKSFSTQRNGEHGDFFVVCGGWLTPPPLERGSPALAGRGEVTRKTRTRGCSPLFKIHAPYEFSNRSVEDLTSHPLNSKNFSTRRAQRVI